MTSADPLLAVLGALAGHGLVAIHAVRGGHACNSSSSHSIIIQPPDAYIPEETPDGYGWEDFALTTVQSKLQYLANQLGKTEIDERPTLEKIFKEAGVDLSDLQSVDHQSRLDFPQSQTEPGLSGEFLEAFTDFLAHPQVAILGGNDNDGYSRHGNSRQVLFNLLGGDWIARKDQIGGQAWWVLYNRNDGTKLRISLDPEKILKNARKPDNDYSTQLLPSPLTPGKAQTPELVDMKLTCACPFEGSCAYCYMGSTKDGKAASLEFVTQALAALASLKVFEVAFGGGEPTLWPHFTQAVLLASQLGVTPNVTSRNYGYLNTPEAARTLPHLGAIAFSVNSVKDLNRLDKELTKAALNYHQSTKIAIQAIPALQDEKTLEAILDYAQHHYTRVTLLGYKTSGRGAGYQANLTDRPAAWWMEQWNKRPYLPLSIDTTLAQQCQKELAAAGIPKWMYHVSEGSYSMYLDAVEQRAGASSYTPNTTPLELGQTPLVGQIQDAFQSYPGEPRMRQQRRAAKTPTRGK